MTRRWRGWEWPEFERSSRDKEPSAAVFFPSLFLLYLADPVVRAFHSPDLMVRVSVLATVLLAAASYVWTLSYGRCAARRTRVALISLLGLFPILLALLLGPGMLVFFTYAVSASMFLLPALVALAIGLGATTALVVATEAKGHAPDWESVLVLIAVTVVVVAVGGMLHYQGELRRARADLATLAVAEERARLARDLHDVLGHSLTTITVKAGLARRMLEDSPDRERAIAEVRDVERLARQASTDIRATVSQYRKVSLPAEIVGARAALLAAGIEGDLPHAVDNVPVGLQEAFGYVLREGVTNVIRHSGARRCEVRLGESWIEVRDDGTGCQSSTSDGNGLAGLAERLAKVGGTVSASSPPGGGFVLSASLAMTDRPVDGDRTAQVEPA